MDEAVKRALGLSIKTPTEFFCKCWNELINKIESGDPDIDISNWPRQILQSIELEIYHNPDESKKQKEIQKLVTLYNRLNKRISFMGNFSNSIVFNTNKMDVLITDIKKEQQVLDDKLFDTVSYAIIDEVNNCNQITLEFKQNITYLVGIIIDEFIRKGFNISYVKDLPKCPDCICATEFGNVILAPSSFEGIDRSDYASDEDYKKELSDYIKKRNISKRIGTIIDYFHKTLNTYTVCYRITGIRGRINILLGKVKLSSELSNYDDSNFHKGNRDKNFIYASVNIQADSPESALIKGISDVESILSILTLKVQTKRPFVVNKSNAIVFQQNKVCLDRSPNKNDNTNQLIDYYESIDIGRYLPCFQDSCSWAESIGKDLSVENEVANSLFWYKKACHAIEDSDRLLFLWISLEKIISVNGKTDKLPCICAHIITPHIYYNQWYNLYTQIRYHIDSECVYIPEEIKAKAGLSAAVGQVIQKEVFLNCLVDIENCIDDEMLKTTIQETNNFYHDIKYIDDKKSQIINDFYRIKIIRNMILHNAVYNKDSIRIYASKAYYYCTCVLNCILYNMEKQKTNIHMSKMIARIDEENKEKFKQIKCEIENRTGKV